MKVLVPVPIVGCLGDSYCTSGVHAYHISFRSSEATMLTAQIHVLSRGRGVGK
jgi:hypothetical protein